MINIYPFGLIFVCASLFMPMRIFSQTPERPDNFDVFQQLCDSVAGRITKKSAALSEIPIVLAPIEDQASLAKLLHGKIIAGAIEKGRAVYSLDSSSNDSRHLQINNRVMNHSVTYSTVKTGLLFRKSTRRRHVAIEVDTELIEKPAGRVWLHDLLKAEYADTVRSSEINELENPQIPFTVGDLRRGSAWSHIMEPLLLAVGTGVAIYALYALRSQ